MAKRTWKIRSVTKWSCLSLTILLLAIWIASGWFTIVYRFEHSQAVVAFGQFQVMWNMPLFGGTDYTYIRWQTSYHSKSKMNGLSRSSLFTYWFHHEPADGFGSLPRVLIPLWSFALLPAIPAATFFTRDLLNKRKHAAQGKCSHCNFDLTGLPPNSKCPECGTLTPSQLPPSIATHT